MKKCFMLLVAVLFMFPHSVLAYKPGDEIIVSVPAIRMSKGELITAFELVVTSGSIVSIDHIPDGWSLNLQSDQSSRVTASGVCPPGSGGLPSSRKLPEFTVRAGKPSDDTKQPLSVNAKITVASGPGKTREIMLGFEKMFIARKDL